MIDADHKPRTSWLLRLLAGGLVTGLLGSGLSPAPGASGQSSTTTHDTAAAVESLAALEAAYETERQQFQQRITRATTEVDREQIVRDMQSRQSEFNRQFLELAGREPGSPQSLAALTWILKNDFVASADSHAALSLLTAHHLTDGDLSEVCQRLIAWAPAPDAELFLRRAAESSSRRTQAAARFALVRSLQQQPARRSEAEPILEDLAARFADVPSSRGSVADAARSELFELQNLSVGRRAPEITGPDLQGRPLALSDFRGRVVLLHFWGSWCPHCRANAPRMRQIVERLNGRPFAVLGVDSDSDRELARQFLADQQLDYRSWYDGDAVTGPIASQWNVVQWPVTYLLDHQGVIRAKFQGEFPDELDGAIDQLVAHVPHALYARRAWPWLLGAGLVCVAVALLRFWRQHVPGPARL